MVHTTFTDQNFNEEVLKSETPVLVDFWATWCPPCRIVGPIIDELAHEFGEKVKIGKLDVDQNPQAPGNFNIMSLPTVVLFKGGQPVKVMVGAQSKEAYKKVINEVLGN